MNLRTVVYFIIFYNFVQLLAARKTRKKKFDFIIVGGGTAGTVLAARLSEISSWTILLIEAGKNNQVLNHIPAITTRYQRSRLDWQYEIEPQNNSCGGLIGRQLFWPAGKVLGGTSEINYMVYTRGNKEDYNVWESQGNPGWSYDEVLPYFMKSERYCINRRSDEEYHNKEGKMSIEHPYTTVVSDTFLNGANELGFDIHDYNGRSQLRFSRVKAHLDNGQRHSPFKAFLEPIHHHRKNLKIVLAAQVTKIIIDRATKTAKGVVYVENNHTRRVFAGKEVILSAGVIGSSKLLLLSGIGPKKELKKLKIPVIQDLMVGQGVRDHISYFGLNYLTNLQIDFDHNYVISVFSCNKCHKSVASSPAGIEAIGFVQLNDTIERENAPDVEILLVNHLINQDLKILTNIEDSVYEKCFKIAEDFVGVNIFPILLHPKSRGFIKLKSKNPFESPFIQPNYLSEKEDVKKLVKAIKFLEKLVETRPFLSADAALYPVPVCDEFKMYSEEYWECAVRTLTMSFYDYMGGCKMGPKTDKEAVVDSELQVHGVKKLMVVDASIIPVTISGHIGAATIMIAEKAADMIKQKYKVS